MIAMECMEERDKQDILDAISLIADQLQGLTDGFHGVTGNVQGLTGQIQGLTKELHEHVKKTESEFASIRNQMVTKNYLDDKLSDLRGDLVALTRKSNVKLSVLIDGLVKEGSLKKKTADLILAMEPFAQK